jgi:fatty acid desaturase
MNKYLLTAASIKNGDIKARRYGSIWVRAVNYTCVSYCIIGYITGVALVLQDSYVSGILGTMIVAHTTVWSALLTHEFMHNTIFASKRLNVIFGSLMTIISGACYVSYQRLRQQHLDHHRHNVGYDGFSITEWVMTLQPMLRRLILALEYVYFPILSIVARCRALLIPFVLAEHRPLRRRIVVVLLLRCLAYAVAFSISPVSILWLFLAHIIVLNIFRVFDCFHHTFDIIPLGTPAPKTDRAYEQEHTYSSLISRKRPWLNWIVLNYGFHNAHHQFPAANWVDLPRHDRALYNTNESHCIYFLDLLRWYHHNRIARIRFGIGRPRVNNGRLEINEFWGVIMNISFMVYDV